jgi:uncharacterized phage protein gp47/JayE
MPVQSTSNQVGLEVLLTEKTEQEAQAEIAADLADRQVSDKSFPDGSTQRELINNQAAARVALSTLNADAVRAGSTAMVLDIPEERGQRAWLEHLGRGSFGLPPDPATHAYHLLRLTNVANGLTRTFNTRDLRVKYGNVEFTNEAPAGYTEHGDTATLPPGAFVDLTFKALVPGSSGNIPANTATTMVKTFAGVSVNNPVIPDTGSSIIRPGRDEESSPAYLGRMQARYPGLTVGGGRGAYVEWIDEAFKYADRDKTITKWKVVSNESGPGSTDIYLATDTGIPTTSDINLVNDYGQLRRTQGGGPLRYHRAEVLLFAYWAELESTRTDAVALAKAAEATYTKAAPIGGKVYRNELIKRIQSQPGMKNIDIKSGWPETDTWIQLATKQVIVLSGVFTLKA